MAKINVDLRIDNDLLTKLETYSRQTGLTVMELIERFCQQGLEMTPESTSVDARINSPKDNLLTSRVDAVETDVKGILERLSILESKIDVDVDVNDYLENWENSLEIKIASLADTFVQKRIEVMLAAARRLAELGSAQVVTSDTTVGSSKAEGLADDYSIYSDDDDEPDEILTDFLEP